MLGMPISVCALFKRAVHSKQRGPPKKIAQPQLCTVYT
jgi:hypothetical protein